MRRATGVLAACALAVSACSTQPPAREAPSTPEESPADESPSPTEPVPPELEDPEFAALVSARNRFHSAFEDFRTSGSPVAGQATVRRMRRAWDDFEVALEDAADAGLDLTTEQLHEDILTTTDAWIGSVQEVTGIAVKCGLGESPSQSEVQACLGRFPEFQSLVVKMAQLTVEVARQQERLGDAIG